MLAAAFSLQPSSRAGAYPVWSQFLGSPSPRPEVKSQARAVKLLRRAHGVSESESERSLDGSWVSGRESCGQYGPKGYHASSH